MLNWYFELFPEVFANKTAAWKFEFTVLALGATVAFFSIMFAVCLFGYLN